VVGKTQLISHRLIEHFRIDKIVGSIVSLLNIFENKIHIIHYFVSIIVYTGEFVKKNGANYILFKPSMANES